MTLDERLSAVAKLVRPGSRVADIGTDHAYLPVYLITAGICPSAIAADIGAGPLNAARRTVTEAGSAEKIELRLGDGLSVIAPDEADDIVIAGMGGETVAAILAAAPWIGDARYRLILQPMSRAAELRRYLMTNGFSLTEEHLVTDGRHLYPVMAAEYTAAPPEEDEFCHIVGALSPTEGRAYFEQCAADLLRRAEGAKHRGNTNEAKRLTALAERLKRYTEENK